MIIKKEEIIKVEKPNFLGGEGTLDAFISMDELGKILRATLKPHSSIGFHTHEENYKVLYVIKGNGKVLENGVESPIKEGEIAYCKKGQGHSLINDTDSDLEFFAVVPNAK